MEGKIATTNKVAFKEVSSQHPGVKWVPRARVRNLGRKLKSLYWELTIVAFCTFRNTPSPHPVLIPI